MNIVYFDDLNSYEELDLILTSKTISAPKPKTAMIDIPGGDGVLDYTEYFGEVRYENRSIELEFATLRPKEDFLSLFSAIQERLHGKVVKIKFSEDLGFYYKGRITVDKWKSNGRIGKIAMEIDAEPFKYRENVTGITRIITTATYIVCNNLHKAVVPKITLTGSATIEYGNYTTTRDAGTFTDEELTFVKGENVIKVTPSSDSITITLEYQERGL